MTKLSATKPKPSLKTLKSALQKASSPARAKSSQRFFKTGPGQYGEGDIFIGITTPELRVITRDHATLTHAEIRKLLHSKIHEERSVGIMILGEQFEKASEKERAKIFKFYLKNRERVNNWDLVDGSAPQIVGKHLLKKERKILYQLARSKSLWDRRIAVVATYTFIREKDFADIFRLAKLLLKEEHDLMHKAIGWMLREVGKRDRKAQHRFLLQHRLKMPRTMLRYAIEHYSPADRKKLLSA